MHEGRNAPFGRAGTWFLAGLIGGSVAAALGGCTALVQFDDPPADEDGGADAGSPDATAHDGSSALLDATADAADARDTSSHPGDAAPSADVVVPDASDGSTDLLAACPTACENYTGDFWVCGWKRAPCIADSADLNIVFCEGQTAAQAYVCPTGETCLGSDNEDFCDPCKGMTGPMCDPNVKDSAHPAYLVNCMGTSPPTYQTCSDSECNTCTGAVRTTTPPS